MSSCSFNWEAWANLLIHRRPDTLQTRAYLDISGVEFYPKHDAPNDRSLEFHLTIVNNGQTPAFRVEYLAQVSCIVAQPGEPQAAISADKFVHATMPDVNPRDPVKVLFGFMAYDFAELFPGQVSPTGVFVANQLNVVGLGEMKLLMVNVLLRYEDVSKTICEQHRQFVSRVFTRPLQSPEELSVSQTQTASGEHTRDASEMADILDWWKGGRER